MDEGKMSEVILSTHVCMHLGHCCYIDHDVHITRQR